MYLIDDPRRLYAASVSARDVIKLQLINIIHFFIHFIQPAFI